MKKSQIYGQIFTYILMAFLVSLILIFGYNSIQNFRSKADDVCYMQLKSDMENSIESSIGDYGSVKKKDIKLCGGYFKICMVETFNEPILPTDLDPIMRDSIISKAGRNIFLFDKNGVKSFYAGNISLDSGGVLCMNSSSILKLEGKGNRVLIGKW